MLAHVLRMIEGKRLRDEGWLSHSQVVLTLEKLAHDVFELSRVVTDRALGRYLTHPSCPAKSACRMMAQ